MWFSAPPDGSGHGGSETPESNWWSGYTVRSSVPSTTSKKASSGASNGCGKGIFTRVIQRFIFLLVVCIILMAAYLAWCGRAG